MCTLFINLQFTSLEFIIPIHVFKIRFTTITAQSQRYN